jgi:hypothetical protein
MQVAHLRFVTSVHPTAARNSAAASGKSPWTVDVSEAPSQQIEQAVVGEFLADGVFAPSLGPPARGLGVSPGGPQRSPPRLVAARTIRWIGAASSFTNPQSGLGTLRITMFENAPLPGTAQPGTGRKRHKRREESVSDPVSRSTIDLGSKVIGESRS